MRVPPLQWTPPASPCKRSSVDALFLPNPQVVVDECHCVTEWGHSFRPSYYRLGRRLRQDLPSTSLLALTATATHRAEMEIRTSLGIQKTIRLDSVRQNLRLHVRPNTSGGDRGLRGVCWREGHLDLVPGKHRRCQNISTLRITPSACVSPFQGCWTASWTAFSLSWQPAALCTRQDPSSSSAPFGTTPISWRRGCTRGATSRAPITRASTRRSGRSWRPPFCWAASASSWPRWLSGWALTSRISAPSSTRLCPAPWRSTSSK